MSSSGGRVSPNPKADAFEENLKNIGISLKMALLPD